MREQLPSILLAYMASWLLLPEVLNSRIVKQKRRTLTLHSENHDVQPLPERPRIRLLVKNSLKSSAVSV
jgi:hypothetical protein